jgi:uncharacterized damage-inducible protein DinB
MKNNLLTQFDLHQQLYNNVLANFTDEETNRRLQGDTNMNHVKYIAGHLVNSQYIFAFLAGVKVERKWDELFAGRQRTKVGDDISYPSIETIKTEWNDIYDEIRDGLEQLFPDDLNRIPPKPLDTIFEDDAIIDNTVGGLWAFFNDHQAYHIGQIGILRRGFGKDPMRYD